MPPNESCPTRGGAARAEDTTKPSVADPAGVRFAFAYCRTCRVGRIGPWPRLRRWTGRHRAYTGHTPVTGWATAGGESDG